MGLNEKMIQHLHSYGHDPQVQESLGQHTVWVIQYASLSSKAAWCNCSASQAGVPGQVTNRLQRCLNVFLCCQAPVLEYLCYSDSWRDGNAQG